jgi:hypothetical protein
MTLSALIKKGGLSKAATVTPATTATLGINQDVTVAPVATVTVVGGTEPAVKNVLLGTELTSELLLDEESSIRAWLAHIEETDPTVITEVLDRCRDDLNTRRYFLKRFEEVPETVFPIKRITCGNCTHFERINHQNLGHCAKGEREAIAGLWDTSNRSCKSHIPLINHQGDHYVFD